MCIQCFPYGHAEERICRKRAERSECNERRLWRVKENFSGFHTCSLSRAYSTPPPFLIIREDWINHKSLLYLSCNLHSTNLKNCSYFAYFLQFTSHAAWIILIVNIQNKIMSSVSLKIKTLQPNFLTCIKICLGLFFSLNEIFFAYVPFVSMYLGPSPVFFWFCNDDDIESSCIVNIILFLPYN